jgi:Protein of unknown function (DUF3102)
MTTTDISTTALAEHAAAIRALGKRVIDDVIEIGERLSQCRAILKEDGKWRAWLKDEFDWGRSTADNFINIYTLSKSAGGPNFGHLDLPLSALYLLAAPSTPPEARAEIIERAEAGEQLKVSEVKAVVAKTKPEPKPEPKPKRGVNPDCIPLFKSEDRLEAFCDAVKTPAAKRFISLDQQLELAKAITKSNMRAQHIQSWVSEWVRMASRAQGKIDDEERDDLYKKIPGYEIKDAVAAVKFAARELVAPLLKLEELFKKFPHHPFFGDLGHTLDSVIQSVRQYRGAAGEKSADEIERKLTRLQELEHKARTQEITITGLRSEVEELRAKLGATGTDGDMSVGEFSVAIERWQDLAETLKSIVRARDIEVAELKARLAPPTTDDMPPIPARTAP